MKPAYVVQVVFKGEAAAMNARAQEKFGGDSYRTNGMVGVVRTKQTAEKRLREWAVMGEVAMKEFRRPESLEEALFAIIGAGRPA